MNGADHAAAVFTDRTRDPTITDITLRSARISSYAKWRGAVRDAFAAKD